MSDDEQRIHDDREAREAAKAQVTQRFSALKGALAEKGIGRRVADHAADKARDAADQVADVARESKGIIAGTTGLLGLWFLRRPIAAQARRWWPVIKARLGKENDW